MDMKKVNIPAVIFVLSALTIMAINFWTRATLPISRETGRLLGMFIFLSGMILFTWAGLSLKGAFYGNVKPVTDQLVMDRLYRYVRHPLYLSMIVSLVGLCLTLSSLLGIVGVFIVFLPAVVYSARLEEEALDKKVGAIWREYTRKTEFLFPFLW
jgi:protein-S-isoprenylcysteine O-methyltransferase Ste14